MTVRFAIRDDDTNYFTRVEHLEELYGALWDRHPVSLAVVPFHGCTVTGAMPLRHWSGSESFAIHRNRDLVAFLKKRIREGRISILLHGFDHVDRDGRPEFATTMDEDEFERRIVKGRDYLQDLLETSVRTFVPPHNTLSRAALAALSRLSMNVLGTFSFRPSLRPFSVAMLLPMARRKLFLSRCRLSGWRSSFYPYPLKVGNHSEMACHDLNHDPAYSLSKLIARLEKTERVSGDFCLATHYWEMKDPVLAEWLKQIIHRASIAGAEFVHADALFARESQ